MYWKYDALLLLEDDVFLFKSPVPCDLLDASRGLSRLTRVLRVAEPKLIQQSNDHRHARPTHSTTMIPSLRHPNTSERIHGLTIEYIAEVLEAPVPLVRVRGAEPAALSSWR